MKIINFLRARFRKWLNEEYWMEDYLKMGMKVGKECDIHPGLIVDYSHCWLIEIVSLEILFTTVLRLFQSSRSSLKKPLPSSVIK